MRDRTQSHFQSLIAAAALAVIVFTTPVVSRASRPAPDVNTSDLVKPERYEALIGYGGAIAYENDIFNVTPDHASTPDGFVDFRAHQLLNSSWAFGFHIFGTRERTADYYLVPAGFTTGVTSSFELIVGHVGPDVRYRFGSGPVRPYVEAGLSFVTGGVDNNTYGHLTLQGFSFGPGAGVLIRTGANLLLGAEAQYAYGRARWKEQPSVTSSSKDYDPSLLAFAGMIGWRWGH